MASAALGYAKELLLFQSLEYADEKLTEQRLKKSNTGYDSYDASMVKFLLGNINSGLNLLEELKEDTSNSQTWFQAWFNKIYSEFTATNLTKEDAINKVKQAVSQRRAYFMQKPSFKKMNKQYFD